MAMTQPNEFYEAKALLLGMNYSTGTHSFWRLIDPRFGYTGNHEEFDADTLQPLTMDQLSERQWKKYVGT